MARPKKATPKKATVAKLQTFAMPEISDHLPPAPERRVTIEPPNLEHARVHIRGTAPYVQHRFAAKAINVIRETQEAGHQSRKGKKRSPKDFKAAYEAATYRSKEGWYGLPSSTFRKAMISACRTTGFKMTVAKLSLFVVADGFDHETGEPLSRITKGEPHMDIRPARNSNGSTDLRCRPMWKSGWEAEVTLRWDADQFTAADVVNLMARVGGQVGIGEGRADSTKSCGVGWGHFVVLECAPMTDENMGEAA